MIHRCPRCGAARAERRTAKSYRERAALAVFGYHPYRCVDCERRFLDRPRPRADDNGARAAASRKPEREMSAAPVAPPEAARERAGSRARAGGHPGRTRRRKRWVVDPGNSPLVRTEIYALVLAAALAALVLLTVLRLMWPEATGGVRLGAD